MSLHVPPPMRTIDSNCLIDGETSLCIELSIFEYVAEEFCFLQSSLCGLVTDGEAHSAWFLLMLDFRVIPCDLEKQNIFVILHILIVYHLLAFLLSRIISTEKQRQVFR